MLPYDQIHHYVMCASFISYSVLPQGPKSLGLFDDDVSSDIAMMLHDDTGSLSKDIYEECRRSDASIYGYIRNGVLSTFLLTFLKEHISRRVVAVQSPGHQPGI